MTSADEFVPPDNALNQIFQSAIVPVLRDLESALGENLPVVLTLYRRELCGPKILVNCCSSQGERSPLPKGEIRLRVRKSGDPKRCAFFAEAIFKEVAPKIGFSGFILKGDLREKGENYEVLLKSSVTRYNVWGWSGWT